MFFERNGIEYYWTGALLDYKTPEVTHKIDAAKKYEYARAAYDDAAPHKKLQSFRVGRRLSFAGMVAA